MQILYISHCVPWPPDKGDRIRAHYSLRYLVKHHDVHLAALARTQQEVVAVSDLREQLKSVRIQVLDLPSAVSRGALALLRGGSFTSAFHLDPGLRNHIVELQNSFPIDAAVLLSSSMAEYAEVLKEYVADWGDVDSEKRLQYAHMRFPGAFQALEGHRLRKIETTYALRSRRTFFTTQNELQLFQDIAPTASLGCAGNGVDADFFDPDARFDIPIELRQRKFLVFVGVLNYFPNSDGARWFTNEIFPNLRSHYPDLELFLVGRYPTRTVAQLSRHNGVTVTGAVKDVRPYLAAARGVIAPLRIARGVQNKVLEALAMGKHVLASDEVCRTFAPNLPYGIVRCATPADYARAVADLPTHSAPDATVVSANRNRFSWARQLQPLLSELASIEQERASSPSSSYSLKSAKAALLEGRSLSG